MRGWDRISSSHWGFNFVSLWVDSSGAGHHSSLSFGVLRPNRWTEDFDMEETGYPEALPSLIFDGIRGFAAGI